MKKLAILVLTLAAMTLLPVQAMAQSPDAIQTNSPLVSTVTFENSGDNITGHWMDANIDIVTLNQYGFIVNRLADNYIDLTSIYPHYYLPAHDAGNGTVWLRANADGAASIEMGNMDITEKDWSFGFDSTSTMTIPSEAFPLSYDEITINIDNLNLLGGITSDTTIYDSPGNPDIVLTADGDIEIDLSPSGASHRVFPNGQRGDIYGISVAGCQITSYWQCLNENPEDEDLAFPASHISAAFLSGPDIEFGDHSLPSDAIISDVSVRIRARGKPGGSSEYMSMRFESSSTDQVGTSTGSQLIHNNEFKNYIYNPPKVGGGSWSLNDIEDIVVGIDPNNTSGAVTLISNLYLDITYSASGEIVCAGVTYPLDLTIESTSSSVSASIDGERCGATQTPLHGASGSVVIGNAEFSIDNLEISGNDFTGNLGAEYNFEPLSYSRNLSSYVEGNSDNSWTWTGKVNDVSSNIVKRDADYSLVRAWMETIAATVSSPKASYSFRAFTPPQSAISNKFRSNLDSTLEEHQANKDAIPLTEFFDQLMNPQDGTPTAGLGWSEDQVYFFIVMVIGLTLGVGASAVTHNPSAGLAVAGVMFAVGGTTGLYNWGIGVIAAVLCGVIIVTMRLGRRGDI